MSRCVGPDVYLRDQLQVVDVVLLSEDELVSVALPLPLLGTQHVEQVQVSTPCNTPLGQTPANHPHSQSHFPRLDKPPIGELWKCYVILSRSPVARALGEEGDGFQSCLIGRL